MALKGIKVIEFAGLAPAPFCGKILRDLGARVIRIDKLGSSFTPDRLSHDKESIAINLKDKEGVRIVKNLTDNADVLIEPFRKGVMERLGLGPNIICKSNPKIIYARLTGYGQFGELSEKAGHDINYISYSGVLSSLGREKDKPYAPINLIADFAGGGLMCALAILSALYERKNENKGKVIDLSMVEGSAYLSTWLWASRDLPGIWDGASKGTNLLDGGYHAYDTYETKDGQFMACGSLEPSFYKHLLKGLGLNESASEITKEILEYEFKKKTRKEWVEIFKDLDACVSPVLSLDEAPLHNHNKERDSFVKLNNNTSVLPDMNWLGLNKSNRPFEMPQIGQQTSIILKELGYNETEINQLIENCVVGSDNNENKNIKSKL